MRHFPLIAAAMALVLAGCTADAPTTVEPETRTVTAGAAVMATVDVAGEWQWSRDEHLTFPPFAAVAIFGVTPEGERTIATCHTEGEITLSQAGSNFSGDEITTASACETNGGQTFAITPSAHVAGEIVGRTAIHMAFQGMVTCLVNGAAQDIVDGIAYTLRGGGRCVVPGHPQSPVPGFDPPPLGTEVITNWTAVRE